MRKDFCEFLLDSFPLLREYGNVSYRFPDPNIVNDVNSNSSLELTFDSQRRKDMPKIVGTILVIDSPD